MARSCASKESDMIQLAQCAEKLLRSGDPLLDLSFRGHGWHQSELCWKHSGGYQ